MPDQADPLFLSTLSVMFGSYGVWQLVLAWRLEQLDEWVDKVLPGAGGVMVGALFATCSYRLLSGG